MALLSSYGFFYVLFKLLRRHQHFPGFGSFLFPYHAGFRQLIHDPGSAVEADLKGPLQHADGSLVLLDDKLTGFHEIFVPFRSRTGRGRSLSGADAFELFFNILAVDVSDSLILQEIHHIGNFPVRNEGALNPGRL